MTTFQIEAQVSSDKLLKAVGQLSPSDLAQFVSEVIALQAQRKAASRDAYSRRTLGIVATE